MAIQVVKMVAPSSFTGLTMLLLEEFGDTEVSEAVATQGTNDPSLFSATFDVAAARYRSVLYLGDTPVVSDFVTIEAASGTYPADSLQEQATADQIEDCPVGGTEAGVKLGVPGAGDAGCVDQNTIPAKQTVVDGCPVLPKLQCHEIQQGQDARLLWEFKNQDGEAVNLTECDAQCSESSESVDEEAFDTVGTPVCTVQLRMREITGNCRQDKVFVIPVDILDSDSGVVRACPLPEELLRAPGVYMEEWGVFTPDTRMLFSNQCCTFIRRGLFGLTSTNRDNIGPPTIEEIRLALRDNSPEDNLLLDDIEFDSAEIAQAVIRPINYWNEVPPPIRPVQTTKTFPFKEIWMLGIQSYLLETAAHHYRRNQFAYQAGGIAVDDKNKEQAYAIKANEMRLRFQELARAKKIEINISLFAGSVGSEYSRLFY